MNVSIERVSTMERGASTIVEFEVCRKPLTSLSFLCGSGSGGGYKKRKGALAVVHGGERRYLLRYLVMVRT